MPARLIHFGWDDCYRVQVLHRAGYEVRESESLAGLVRDLQQGDRVDAVLVSEEEVSATEEAAIIARRCSEAPVILFRRSQRILDESQFDRVYSHVVTPQLWLEHLADLIARARSSSET